MIEEPQPPEEVAEPTPATESPSPPPVRRRPRPARSDATSASEEAPPEPEGPAPAPTEVPALEAREAPAQQVALRRQILDLQQSLHQRTGQLERLSLSASNHKTFEDARTFLAQSERALADGDLQRALNLGQKASLLISAIDQELNR